MADLWSSNGASLPFSCLVFSSDLDCGNRTSNSLKCCTISGGFVPCTAFVGAMPVVSYFSGQICVTTTILPYVGTSANAEHHVPS